jgi:hypothetical protein
MMPVQTIQDESRRDIDNVVSPVAIGVQRLNLQVERLATLYGTEVYLSRCCCCYPCCTLAVIYQGHAPASRLASHCCHLQIYF